MKPEVSFEVNAWYYLPNFIKWFTYNRNGSKYDYLINLNVILNSTIFIEGFLFDLLFEYVEKKKINQKKEFHPKIEENIIKGNLKEYKILFEDIIGYSINNCLTEELSKSNIILFRLRNQITHGTSVKVEIIETTPIEHKYQNRYNEIYKYLLELNLIEKNKDLHLVNDAVADHFWGISKQVVKSIKDKVNLQHSVVNSNYRNAFK